jgi:hypothetical protein
MCIVLYGLTGLYHRLKNRETTVPKASIQDTSADYRLGLVQVDPGSLAHYVHIFLCFHENSSSSYFFSGLHFRR